MLKKVFSLSVLVLVIIGAVILWREYHSYEARKQARLQKLQQQAAEVQVTTIEGWTIKDIAQVLEQKQLFSAKQFLDAQQSFNLDMYPLVKSSKPKSASLEGFLFPDTYRFNTTSDPDAVIGKMLNDFILRMGKIGVREAKDYTIAGYETHPMSFYEVLTLASIIEKETGGKGPMSLEDERALVSGVFYNRLLNGQALESDATVNYATGKSSPGASAEDIQINSPYNTYKYPGLPPGPICNPSLSSINAALHPQKTDYNYFFHKQPSGEAVFSKTFDEHKRKKAAQ
jgi:UPF0755 protein